MIVSLIGFSGTGKSYWARKLAAELGFNALCCDELIEEKLKRAHIFRGCGIHAVADWMGMPYEERFAQHEKQYLAFEEAVMDEVFVELETQARNRPVVIDTTGSVIYTGAQRCKKLQAISRVIYLDVDSEKIDQMRSQFVAHPKPIVWNNMFSQQKDESQTDALARCYRELLLSRAELYKQYADVTLPYTIHKKKNLSAREFIELVSQNEVL